MTVNSDGTVGCFGTVEPLEIGRSPKLSCTAFETSCSVFPTDGANCGLLLSQNHWIVGAFTG